MRIFRIAILVIASVIGLYLLSVTLFVFGPSVSNYTNSTEFDSKKWKDWVQSEEQLALRWHMISDLRDNYEIKGMSTDEIIELLGDPDTRDMVEWTYFLGETGRGIDTGTLSLTFEGGIVRSFEVRNL